jgi:hypothetical protein
MKKGLLYAFSSAINMPNKEIQTAAMKMQVLFVIDVFFVENKGNA